MLLGAGMFNASAREVVCDSVEVHYRLNKYDLDLGFRNNKARLDSLVSSMGDSALRKVTGIRVIGGASPEGSISLNDNLSRHRAASFIDYLDNFVEIPDSIISYSFLGRDWTGLYNSVAADPNVPNKDQVMRFLGEIMDQNNPISNEDGFRDLQQLATIAGGKPFDYIYKNIFPELRKALFIVEYLEPFSKVRKLNISSMPALTFPAYNIDPVPVKTQAVKLEYVPTERKPFYMALKTNMLYDALAVPNLYAEFYLGKQWSLAGGGMYAWWSYDRRHRYWRLYGGELTLRHWFGKAAALKPLTGHHLGIYAGVLTFDFEWGGKGYLGGKPHGTLLDRCLYNAGIEYGYSLPVAKRFNIDFTLGLGYFGGKYYKYEPFFDQYLKSGEYRISFWGPTKAEISLVWLIGRGNTNKKKGGRL